ncbi:MAG: AAA family ATPase [Cyanobacteria bacterium P01_A01_bin.83]
MSNSITVSFSNLKGGVGKSSTAVHFIYWLSEIKKKSAILVDADGQSSSSNWIELLELDIPVNKITDPEQLGEKLPELALETEYLVVDNGGNLGDGTMRTLLSADITIIPITPSGLDVLSAASAVRLVSQIQRARKGLPKTGIFINRAVKNTKLLKQAKETISQIENIKPFKNVIYQRQLLADCFLQGSVAWEMTGSGAKEAAKDYEKLFKEILELA